MVSHDQQDGMWCVMSVLTRRSVIMSSELAPIESVHVNGFLYFTLNAIWLMNSFSGHLQEFEVASVYVCVCVCVKLSDYNYSKLSFMVIEEFMNEEATEYRQVDSPNITFEFTVYIVTIDKSAR